MTTSFVKKFNRNMSQWPLTQSAPDTSPHLCPGVCQKSQREYGRGRGGPAQECYHAKVDLGLWWQKETGQSCSFQRKECLVSSGCVIAFPPPLYRRHITMLENYRYHAASWIKFCGAFLKIQNNIFKIYLLLIIQIHSYFEPLSKSWFLISDFWFFFSDIPQNA